MSKTYRAVSYQPAPPPRPTIEEDEDTDPRSYNVIQRNDQERDSFRLEKSLSDQRESMGLHVWDD